VPIFKLNCVNVPHLKKTEHISPQKIPIPKSVTIPMLMHIGAPAKPIVKPGDMVKVGQMIAESGGFVSAPIHTGVSGKVKKIDNILLSSGQTVEAVIIESDGEQSAYEEIKPPTVTNLEEFLAAIRNSGVVGLGGAGFPTEVKLAVKDLSKIETVIINGAECEPYITSDTRTMIDDTEFVWEGIELIQKYLQVKKVIIGIEDNKPECIKAFNDLCGKSSGVEVKSLPASYPQGGEKVMIFNTIGRVVPEGKLPLDVGVVVLNCTTLAVIAKYIKTGMPLVEKCVTVDGSAVKEPQNVIVPIGTPISDVFEFCGGFAEEPRKIIFGGPMMGISATDINAPILKTTNAVIALSEKDAVPPKETACIKCGRCVNSCPLNLMPYEIETAFNRKNGEMLEKLKVNICMECGCCSYVCPAHRNLIQVHKLSKVMLKNYQETTKA
jgi:electron transport complex, RnfABCDGE type, C subunit